MGAIKDSMKIIEMSEQQIDALKTIVDELDLSDENKAAVTYGLNLIIWLPKLILEQRISLHRLQLMLLGKATAAKSSKNNSDHKTGNNKKPEDNETPANNDKLANDEDLDITSTSDVDDEPQKSGRTGRKPHTEYKAIDHFIPHEDINSGDLCPEKCGGKVYDFSPKLLSILMAKWMIMLTVIQLRPNDAICVANYSDQHYQSILARKNMMLSLKLN